MDGCSCGVWGRLRFTTALLLPLLYACGPLGQPSAAPAGTHVTLAEPTPYPVQPTYTALPTYTPYPPQPTYTPLPLPSAERMTVSPAFPAAATATSPVPGLATEGENIDDMLVAINAVRTASKCAPLALDERLQQAAAGHALDIATRRKVDHLGADGSTLEERLKRAGYPFERRSEIVGAGSLRGVMDAWLSEQTGGPHRASLTNCLYTDAGIGLGITSDGRNYWVVDLASPK